MKTLFAYLGMLLMTITLTHGQATKSSLTKDSDFLQLMAKSLRYPQSARQAEKVAKAYIEFKIDDLGKVADISVLNPDNVDTSFKEETKRIMSQLPAQKPIYAGKYVLPVIFVLEGSGRVLKPREEAITFVQSLPKESILSEVYVVGYLQ
ncbi:energy transducer TonB [Spirosoma sp. BT702]|uniref:Energy transducer TonB n=1 Tax=Spirosoma profusum TaxID=2771354 RepID=A0A927AQ22_9BACT|nr:energy transducer TonB [Spirosoma profusum]MBD2699523.1 energy transducer TonB [Spirosoma profusum]